MMIITGGMQDDLKVFDGMVKIYCEHGALASDLHMLQREGLDWWFAPIEINGPA